MLNVRQGIRSVGVKYLDSLTSRDFRSLWLASMCAGSAHWALIVARGWLVFEMEGSSAWVGWVTFAAMIPRFFLSPFAGLICDRFNRKIVLTTVFAMSFFHNLVLALLVLLSDIQVSYVVVLALIDGSSRAILIPASSSLLPNLVRKDQLLNAIALNATTVHGTRLLGPLLIAPLVVTTGVAGTFFLSSVLYALGGVQVLFIRTHSAGVIDIKRSVLQNLLEGLSYLYHHRFLRPLLLLTVAHCALTMSFESLLPVLSLEKLGAEGGGFTYLMMAVGAGALIGVIGLSGIQHGSNRGQILLVLGILSGVAPIGLAISPNLYTALAAAAVMGATQSTFMALFAGVVQSIIPDAIRGRVASVNNLHIGGSMALFNLVNGRLADSLGAPVLLVIPGVIFVVVIGCSYAVVTLRKFYRAGMTVE